MDRLKKQISFIIETDKLKTIYRQSLISDKSRYENDAEHSWHLALMAVLLSEHTNEQVDLLKVIKMVIIHDIVEIDAGDTYCYDEKAKLDKREREEKCANRIFRFCRMISVMKCLSCGKSLKRWKPRKQNSRPLLTAFSLSCLIIPPTVCRGKTWHIQEAGY